MAELAKKLKYRKTGSSPSSIILYSTTSDVGSSYLSLRVDGIVAYAAMGSISDTNASNLRVRKSGNVFSVLTQKTPDVTINPNLTGGHDLVLKYEQRPVYEWDIESGELMWELDNGPMYYSPDNRLAFDPILDIFIYDWSMVEECGFEDTGDGTGGMLYPEYMYASLYVSGQKIGDNYSSGDEYVSTHIEGVLTYVDIDETGLIDYDYVRNYYLNIGDCATSITDETGSGNVLDLNALPSVVTINVESLHIDL